MAMAMPGLCPIHDSYITNHIKVNVILNYDEIIVMDEFEERALNG